MSVRSLTAAVAVLATLAAMPAAAADLDPYAPPPHAKYGSPYDDPRYADVYRHPPPPPKYVERYEQRFVAPPPPPPRYVERYDDRGYAPAPPPAYSWRGEPPRSAYGCLPREAARANLERQGWHDFHNLQPGADVVHVRARRPNGALFDLTLDRCTGQILDRRYLAGAPPSSYAWRERPDLFPRY